MNEQDREVGICGDRLPATELGPWHVCDLPADHAGWHGANNDGVPGLLAPPTRVSWTHGPDPFAAADLVGYRRAIEALRAKDAEEAEAFERAIPLDGYPFGHHYRLAAEHLESLAAAHKEGEKT